MNVAVPGGTGTLGALVVAELEARGHIARTISRHAAPPGARVDLATGAGLAEALDGIEAVIDCSNVAKAGKLARSVLVDGTARLLRAEREAGAAHHVLISIVGIDELPVAYYKLKVEQERLVQAGPVPYTVLRATQFHQLLDQAFAAASRFGFLPGGSIPVQPVDPREVATRLVDAVEEGPTGERRSFAGPEIAPVGRWARAWRAARGGRRPVLPLPVPPLSAGLRALRGGALTSAAAPRGTVTFEHWLAEPANRPELLRVAAR